jgi:hypothetical protein
MERSEGEPVLVRAVVFFSNPGEQLPARWGVIPLRLLLPAALDRDQLWYPHLSQKAVLLVHFTTVPTTLKMTV